MDPTNSDPVGALLNQAANVVSNSQAVDAAAAKAHASMLALKFSTLAGSFHHYAHGLFPLFLIMFILHEHSRGLVEHHANPGFRAHHVLVKAGIIFFLLVAYPQVCRLITMIAGAGGHWMNADQAEALTDFSKSGEALGSAWNNLAAQNTDNSAFSILHWSGGGGMLVQFLTIFVAWLLVTLASLFAYGANLILALCQSVYLALLLSVGKLAITATLLPGVRLGYSWAKALAQCAAWSTVAGIIAGILGRQNTSILNYIAHGQCWEMLMLSVHFVIFALLTLAVPMLVSSIWGGVAPGLAAAGIGMLAAARIGGMVASGGMKALTSAAKVGKAVGEAGGVANKAANGSVFKMPFNDGGGGAGGGYDKPKSRIPSMPADATPIASPRESLLGGLRAHSAGQSPGGTAASKREAPRSRPPVAPPPPPPPPPPSAAPTAAGDATARDVRSDA